MIKTIINKTKSNPKAISAMSIQAFPRYQNPRRRSTPRTVAFDSGTASKAVPPK